MVRYLFLIAWFEGSDSASGEATGVHQVSDLLDQYQKGNSHVLAVEVRDARDKEQAAVYGRAEAWHDNYTAYDTVSDVVLLEHNYQHPYPNNVAVISAV